MSEQAREIFTCIEQHGPIGAEGIVEKTGWQRSVVDTAIKLLYAYGWIYRSGMTSERLVYTSVWKTEE